MIHLTEDNFENLLQSLNHGYPVDLRETSFIDPYGMIGILEIGVLCKTGQTRQTLFLPSTEEVLRYLERMDFFRFADTYFDLKPPEPRLSRRYTRSAYSDVLLEITPIERSDDIHFIVGRVRERANAILRNHLHYDERAINGFIVALSEVCQNIIEHSENKGFVGIQKYYFQGIRRNVVKIAVMDTGIGFRKSLSERFSLKNDLEAIEKALLHGVSRYPDQGRGHGLAAVRRFVNQWNGKISIRSGRARLSIIPDWSWGKEKEVNLTFFPGSQISILLPEVQS
jgi:anti-sigma regulatory factor (Ser/Thr protein kinase)